MSEFFVHICKNNFQAGPERSDSMIGFSKGGIPIFLIPILALILNLISLINYFRSKNKKK